MAELAAHGAALQEDDEADARSVYGAECFDGMDAGCVVLRVVRGGGALCVVVVHKFLNVLSAVYVSPPVALPRGKDRGRGWGSGGVFVQPSGLSYNLPCA